MTPGVEAEVIAHSEATILRLSGEFRLDAGPVERAIIRLSAARPPLVVIDLAGLAFISSLGMGMLNQFRRGRLAHGGVTRIAAAKGPVAETLKLCNFDKVFEFHDTVESALAATAAS